MLTFPPDISFVIQIASFLVLWFGLKRLLFDPVLHVLEVRESRTTGAAREAAEMKGAAVRSAAEYEQRMHDVRVTLAAEADVARTAMQTEGRQVVSAARERASTQLMQLRESLNRQADAARTGLAADARDLAGRMVERVVGRTLA